MYRTVFIFVFLTILEKFTSKAANDTGEIVRKILQKIQLIFVIFFWSPPSISNWFRWIFLLSSVK